MFIKELTTGTTFHFPGRPLDVYRVTRPVRTDGNMTGITYVHTRAPGNYEFETVKPSLTSAIVVK